MEATFEPRSGNGMPTTINAITLRFSDVGVERGFVKERMPRTIGNFRLLCALALLVSLASLIYAQSWDQGRFPTAEENQVFAVMSFVVVGIAVFAASLIVITFVPGLSSGSNYLALEVFVVMSAVLGMVAHTFALPWYAARAVGVDPAMLGTSSFFGDLTDTRLVLVIDLVVTGTHLALPVRISVIVIVELVSVVCYIVPTWALGGPEMKSGPITTVFLMCLIGMTSWGKRSLEFQERTQFLRLIREKSLRFQSEFEISQHQLAKFQQQDCFF